MINNPIRNQMDSSGQGNMILYSLHSDNDPTAWKYQCDNVLRTRPVSKDDIFVETPSIEPLDQILKAN